MFRRFNVAITCLLVLLTGPAFADKATYLDSFTWKDDDPRFGGLSGFHMFEGGSEFYAISDKGTLLSGNLTRDENSISEISDVRFFELRDDDGSPMSRFRTDAEGLAVRPNGRIYVSFESVHRVWTYSSPTSEGAWMPRHADFKSMQNNSSLEALAIDSSNRLYTLPERSGLMTRPFPVYRYANGKWSIPFSIPRRGEFLVVGADVGPDDRLYILERHFTGWSFQSRLRRFDLDGTNEETLVTTSAGTHDNLEGVSIWRNDAGALIASLISDDNFRFLQRTEIVEYLLPD